MKLARRIVLVVLGFLLLTFVSLWIAGPTPVSLGPYVQNVTSTSADICWFDEVPRPIEVTVVGLKPVKIHERSDDAKSAHRVRFDGFAPGTSYHYEVNSADGETLGKGSFTTPPVDRAKSFTFTAVGDSGKVPRWLKMRDFGWERFRGVFPRTAQWDVGEWMAVKNPDLFVHLGDIIYSHDQLPAYKEAFFRPFEAVLSHTTLVATLGNHDMHTWEHPEFFRVFHTPKPLDPKQKYKDFSHTFTWGSVRFLVLDAFWQTWEPGSEMRQWLEETLGAKSHPRTIVIMHTPAYSDEAGLAENELLQKRLWPLFVQAKVALVISGDSHSYQRFKPIGGVTQVVVGTGGKSIRPVAARRLAHKEERFGFLLVKVTGTRIEGEFWASGETPLDRFDIPE